MKTPLQPPRIFQGDDRPEDLDDLLRRFFQAEMPDPWPAVKFPPSPTPLPLRTPRWTVRLRSHFSLAAAIVSCLIGYGVLQATFPGAQTEHGPQLGKGKLIGSQPKRQRIEPHQPDVVRLPDGTPVLVTG